MLRRPFVVVVFVVAFVKRRVFVELRYFLVVGRKFIIRSIVFVRAVVRIVQRVTVVIRQRVAVEFGVIERQHPKRLVHLQRRVEQFGKR